ncbi:uncharacterized protein BKA55DRAFT_585388 [Fusarium redolens]|uniref:Transmembrane protein n=1 Tax=Fusarium redolens TaxID=48865 RepID=A0A9P9FVM4_FUSRE|nr:uncharacterized protein BKA55DRAFT_585388 [Fusarium redolens]KAH7213291.1 hypothetical protein BKA55DRAFT_585388 [Fusarium redolens]
MSGSQNSYYQQIAVLTAAAAALSTSIATWWNAYTAHYEAGQETQAVCAMFTRYPNIYLSLISGIFITVFNIKQQHCFQQYQICERDKSDKEAQIRDLEGKIRDLEYSLNRYRNGSR